MCQWLLNYSLVKKNHQGPAKGKCDKQLTAFIGAACLSLVCIYAINTFSTGCIWFGKGAEHTGVAG